MFFSFLQFFPSRLRFGCSIGMAEKRFSHQSANKQNFERCEIRACRMPFVEFGRKEYIVSMFLWRIAGIESRCVANDVSQHRDRWRVIEKLFRFDECEIAKRTIARNPHVARTRSAASEHDAGRRNTFNVVALQFTLFRKMHTSQMMQSAPCSALTPGVVP